MILWGRHSDMTGERRWHTAIPLLLAALGFSALNLTGAAIIPTIFAVSCCLVGAYSFKGPFWALSAGWLSASTLAAGLAGINAIANLIGGGIMVNAVGLLKEWSGSYAIAMLPLVVLTLAGAISVIVMRRSHARESAASAVAA
jgi:ACS family tartrate transporter-like MFS transporter